MDADNRIKSYLPRAGLYFGIIGTVSIVFFVLIFLKDWMDRFSYIPVLIPMVICFIYIAKKLPGIGGLLLVILGVGISIFNMYYTSGSPGQIAGKGLGNTMVFVSLPLVISGFLYISYWWKYRKLRVKT